MRMQTNFNLETKVEPGSIDHAIWWAQERTTGITCFNPAQDVGVIRVFLCCTTQERFRNGLSAIQLDLLNTEAQYFETTEVRGQIRSHSLWTHMVVP
jgi:hypothetical protein